MQRRTFLSTPLLPAAASASAGDTRAVEQDLLRRAAEGAEQHRKGDGVVRVLDAGGRPLEGAAVTLDQQSHEFLFGCIVFPLASPRMPAEERDMFQSRYLEIFNLGVFPFYWASYEREPARRRGVTLNP